MGQHFLHKAEVCNLKLHSGVLNCAHAATFVGLFAGTTKSPTKENSLGLKNYKLCVTGLSRSFSSPYGKVGRQESQIQYNVKAANSC